MNLTYAVQDGQPEDLSDRKIWIWWKVQKWALNIAFHCFQRRGSEKLNKNKKGDREQRFGQLWQEQCSLQFLQDILALADRLTRVGVPPFLSLMSAE